MTDERALKIDVSPDRLVAVAVCRAADFGPENFARAVLEEAMGLGIGEVVSAEELIQRYSEVVRSEDEVVEVKIAEGAPPRPPKEAVLEWAQDFFSHQFVQDEATGAVDFRQYKSNPSVAEGQHLLQIIPAEPGEDGKDVFGKRIPTQRPRPVRLRAGKNVRYVDETNSYEAERNGRIRLVGTVLSVDEVYTVSGDVGLATGNIDHPGALEVQGNIETDSQVRCLGHIKVSGYIEAADVDAGGDLEVTSGLTGFRKNPIRAAGSIRSKFIIDSQVIAGEDVWVDREIVHSVVTAGARVMATEGRVVGGRVYGRMLIDVRDAGSPAIVPTMLSAGKSESDEDEELAMERRIDKLHKESERIHEAVVPLAPHLESLPAEKREAVNKLMEMEQSIKEEMSQLRYELDVRKSAPRPLITVRGVVYPETTMCIDQIRLDIREALTGPLVARRVGDRVRLEQA